MNKEEFLQEVEKFAARDDNPRISEIKHAFIGFYSEHYEDGIDIVLHLVTHDRGIMRKIGRELWDSTDVWHKVNILELSEGKQIRLVGSLLQEVNNQEKRLPVILPILNSPNEGMRRMTVIAMQKAVANYTGLVKKLLEEAKFEDNPEVLFLKELIESMEDRVEYVYKCKELWSEYAYSTEFELSERRISEFLSQKSKEAMEKDKENYMVYKMLKSVIAGRSGGVRTKSGQILQTRGISYEKYLPMYMASHSPKEEYDDQELIMQDWSDLSHE